MEDKLKEAAIEYIHENSEAGVNRIDCFIAGAKWQQQSSVDLEEVRERFNKIFTESVELKDETFGRVMKNVYSDLVFDFFAPLIKGSDSVEFAIYVTNMYSKVLSKELRKYAYVPHDLVLVNGSDYHFTKIINEHGKDIHELYSIFTKTKKG